MEKEKERRLIRDFNRLRPVLHSYFSRKGFGPEDCEDLTQETFLQAYRGLEGFRGESEFKTWLFRIAENVFRKTLRRSKARKREMQEIAPEARFGRDSSPLEGLLTQESLGTVRKALDELPPKMQACIFLYVHQERKYREIAALLDLSINTVKSHIHAARKRLKESLGDQFDGFGR